MTISEFIVQIKRKYLQNISSDYFGDGDDHYKVAINAAVAFVFGKVLAGHINWRWARKKETLTPTGRVISISYTAFNIVSVKDSSGQYFYPQTINEKSDVRYAYDNSELIEGSNTYYYDGQNKITFAKDPVGAVDIIYCRFSKNHIGLAGSDQIDLPNELIPSLELFIMWQLLPTHDTSGGSLANLYFGQALNHIDSYNLMVGNLDLVSNISA